MVRHLWPHLDATTTIRQEPGQETSAAPPAPAPRLLQRLGRFEIRAEVGRGRFGVVFRAYDPRLGREVALKVPRTDTLFTPELRARFQTEARAAAGLDHPNLVPVYEAGEEDGVCYIASAYCPGITLAAWLKQRSEPVPFREAAQLIVTLAEAVDHAHRHGVLHRDLKPANILLTRKSQTPNPKPQQAEKVPGCDLGFEIWHFEPKVTDFGLAKLLDGAAGADTGPETQSGAILGTPHYMAPEQAEGQSKGVGPAADVYALGCILYELLTGRTPFQGGSTLDMLLLVRTREPVPPGRLRPRLPRDLETICLLCLRKEPSQRYASARALADDLRRFLAGQPIQARFRGKGPRLGRGLRRHPILAAAGTLAVAVGLLTVVTGGLRPAARTPRPDRPSTAVEPGPGDQESSRMALHFEDTFGGPTPAAEPLFPKELTFTRADGTARLAARTRGILPVIYPESLVQDFVAEFEMRIPGDCPKGDSGLLFRTQRDGTGLPSYNILSFHRDTGKVDLARYDSRAPTGEWTSLALSDWKVEWDRDVPVRLEVVGRYFRVFVNKALLCEATDETPPAPGLLCLFLFGVDQQLTTVQFRKLRVYKPGP
jgi:hypothetical protein